MSTNSSRPRLRVSSHPHSLRQHDVHFVHVPHHAVDQVVRVAVQRRKTRVAETARRLAVNAARSAWTVFLSVFRSVFRSVFLRTRLGRLRVTRWRVARARTISIGGLAVGDLLVHILSLLIGVVTVHIRFDRLHRLTCQGLIIEVFIVLCVRLEHEMPFPIQIRFHIRFHTNHCHVP